ncbi:hypothetical protein HDU97_001889 [Phlyctochytrium planicorne]|nr:hypothetical protein HDU97_001889 [Phlyctochytrium planicorne]
MFSTRFILVACLAVAAVANPLPGPKSPPKNCPHNPCTPGEKLPSDCSIQSVDDSNCIKWVNSQIKSCGDKEWNQICVDKARECKPFASCFPH